MGLFNKERKARIDMTLCEDVGNLSAGMSYIIDLFNDHILIKDILFKKEVKLFLNQITDVYYGIEEEIETKNKSVIGRAVVGGVFGPVGAVVGAVSGVGTKKKKSNHRYMVIYYISSAGEEKYIKFEDKNALSGMTFSSELKKSLPNKKDVFSSERQVIL